MSSYTVLLTGGTGRTAQRLLKLLDAENVPVVLASRGDVQAPFKGAKFDWADASTYENPFNADPNIDRVYLVGPPHINMQPFVEFAMKKGVKRFVLLNSLLIEKGGASHGKLHEFLVESGVDYCVLRPSTFFESWIQGYAPLIKAQDLFFTATGDAKLGFVSTDDIADAAFKALVDEKSHNTEYYIVGPQLISYTEGAEILSQAVRRKITHNPLPADQYKEKLLGNGIPPPLVGVMLYANAQVAAGEDSRRYDSDKSIVGKRYIKDFFEENKAAFTK